jgi:exodeoxyribonuclease VII large subunit
MRVVGGHRYFSLKDGQSQVAAVLFRREATRVRFALKDGLEIVGRGRVTLYPPRGTFQLVLERIEPRGAGARQAAFEELKHKLASEGLFDQERKRRLPLVPRRVAVVTSPTGAVIRDIINVATRRFPSADILVIPTRVQGSESAGVIATAIDRASASAEALGIEVIILARGGGSLEDLWGFNEEQVAHAIYAARVPVVSAVGHETDFTIADFVADRRAPTPSSAAEIVFPLTVELHADLQERLARCARSVSRDIQQNRHRLRAARAVLGDGRTLIAVQTQRLSMAERALARTAERLVASLRLRFSGQEKRLERLNPRLHLAEIRSRVRAADERVAMLLCRHVGSARQRLAGAEGRLRALSPLGILERGYSIVLAPDGQAVRRAGQVHPGDRLDIRVARGRLAAQVVEAEAGSSGYPPSDGS